MVSDEQRELVFPEEKSQLHHPHSFRRPARVFSEAQSGDNPPREQPGGSPKAAIDIFINRNKRDLVIHNFI